MHRYFIMSAAAFGWSVTVASAADLGAPSSWTGFYVGGDVGAAWAKSSGAWNPLDNNYQLNPDYWGIQQIAGGLSSTTGVLAGGHFGYNQQFSSVVLGIEGDWTWTNTKSTLSQPWVLVPSLGGTARPGDAATLSTKLDSLASIRARAGYLVTPNLLFYGTGGFAWADASYDSDAHNQGPSHLDNCGGGCPLHSAPYDASASSSKWVGGWVVGGGLEYALSNNWSLRGEYLFYRLSTANSVTALDKTGTYLGPQPPLGDGLFPSGFTRSDTNVQAARLGASYKF
jgi:outer membrane immunogenic protein